jgi:hypothetical protein
MAVPVINTTTSVIEGFQWQPLTYQPYATNNPIAWACPNLPAGLSLDAPTVYAATGVASTDVITATGNTFADGDRVVMPELTGGAGLTANVIYFVRDRSTHTFKLAATKGGAAINFTTDISAGTISKVPTGKISGSPEVSGTFNCGITATNADGTSAEVVLTIGVGAADAVLTNSGIQAEIDVQTRKFSLVKSEGDADVAKLFVKDGDSLVLWLKFKKNGQTLDLPITSLAIAIKEYEPEARVVLGSTWKKYGSGTGTYYGLYAAITSDELQSAFSSYEADKGTLFDGVSEIEWQETNPDSATFGPAVWRYTTQDFETRLARDMAQEA